MKCYSCYRVQSQNTVLRIKYIILSHITFTTSLGSVWMLLSMCTRGKRSSEGIDNLPTITWLVHQQWSQDQIQVPGSYSCLLLST